MSRLEMAVAPVATPRPAKTIGSIPIGAALIELASGLGLVADQDGQLFLQHIASTKSAARTRAKSGARSARKQAVSTASLIAAAQSMHDLRARASQTIDRRCARRDWPYSEHGWPQHRIGAFKAAAGIRVSRHQAAQAERRRDRDRSPLPPVHLTKRAERLDPCAKGGRSARGYDADRTLAFAAWRPQRCHEWRRHHRRAQPAAEDHPRDLGARPGSSTDTDRFFDHRSVPAIAGWSFSRQPRAAELRDVHEAHRQSRTRDRARACTLLQRSVAGPLRTMGYHALCKQIELSHPVLGSSGHHGTRPVSSAWLTPATSSPSATRPSWSRSPSARSRKHPRRMPACISANSSSSRNRPNTTTGRDLPFSEVRLDPLVTPDLLDPHNPARHPRRCSPISSSGRTTPTGFSAGSCTRATRRERRFASMRRSSSSPKASARLARTAQIINRLRRVRPKCRGWPRPEHCLCATIEVWRYRERNGDADVHRHAASKYGDAEPRRGERRPARHASPDPGFAGDCRRILADLSWWRLRWRKQCGRHHSCS